MANPASAFPSAPPRFFDRGNGAKLLQPQNQVAYQGNLANDANGAAIATAVNGLRNALVVAGIMKAS